MFHGVVPRKYFAWVPVWSNRRLIRADRRELIVLPGYKCTRQTDKYLLRREAWDGRFHTTPTSGDTAQVTRISIHSSTSFASKVALGCFAGGFIARHVAESNLAPWRGHAMQPRDMRPHSSVSRFPVDDSITLLNDKDLEAQLHREFGPRRIQLSKAPHQKAHAELGWCSDEKVLTGVRSLLARVPASDQERSRCTRGGSVTALKPRVCKLSGSYAMSGGEGGIDSGLRPSPSGRRVRVVQNRLRRFCRTPFSISRGSNPRFVAVAVT
jgi:hypothetical protein